MAKHFYPAIFHQEADGYSVRFPDLDGCFTEGDTLEEAYQMANDAIGLYLSEQSGQFRFPNASSPRDIQMEANEFVVLIEFDEVAYRRKHDSKAVKKTLTIPSWLNQIAEENHINFSAVLQDALKQQLHVDS